MASAAPPPLSLKRRLLAGRKAYGVFLNTASPVVAELLGLAGYDLVVVDSEHGPGGTMAALQLLQALAGTGAAAVVRVPEGSAVNLKKALDIGPAGVMVPMVNSVDEARAVVAGCRYPPRGVRGCAYPIVRASQYGFNEEYLATCEDDLLIMAQVVILSLSRIADIAAVDGIDCLFVGPMDLAASIGRLTEPGHSDVMELIQQTEAAILGSKKLLGGFVPPGRTPAEMFDKGYSVVVGSADVALIRQAVVTDVMKAEIPKEGISFCRDP
eukprot:SM000173S03021  [mRNA]  locus=s173:256087:258145:+ [translate_table: standard]